MRKKAHWIIALVLTCLIAFGNSVFAFQDLSGDPAEAKIRALEQQGAISGISTTLFDPQSAITYAQAVQMIVKGFDLRMDHLNFIKEPKASDYFTHVPDDAWYTQGFLVAQLNGLPIPQDVNPYATMTKEAYADLLYHALEAAERPFPIIKIYILIADEADVDGDKMGSVQNLLILKITELDENQQFQPKASITRSESSAWLYNALEFVKKRSENIDPPRQEDVDMTIEPIDDEVNKVTLSWGEKPNGCYGISIEKIEFDAANQEAIIHYILHTPEPTAQCTQVITYPKVSTFVGSHYEVKLQQSGQNDMPVHPIVPRPPVDRVPLPPVEKVPLPLPEK